MEDTPKQTTRRPRQGWQRVKPEPGRARQARDTFRRDAPSPVEEILAKHDAELDDHEDENGDEDETQVFCF